MTSLEAAVVGDLGQQELDFDFEFDPDCTHLNDGDMDSKSHSLVPPDCRLHMLFFNIVDRNPQGAKIPQGAKMIESR